VMDELRRPSRTLGAGIAPRASIGVALVSDRAGATDFPADSEEILAKADAAMYRAKARGKGCYEIWESAVPTVIEL
jgi:GGDEF domain-containing protein